RGVAVSRAGPSALGPPRTNAQRSTAPVPRRAGFYGRRSDVDRSVRQDPRAQLRPQRFQDLVNQKQICQQRADVDRRVEVVDRRRPNRRLREDELQGGLRVTCVAIEDVGELLIGRQVLDAECLRAIQKETAEAAQRLIEASEVLANRVAGVLVGGKALGG